MDTEQSRHQASIIARKLTHAHISAADGYTLLGARTGFSARAITAAKLGFDPNQKFRPVGLSDVRSAGYGAGKGTLGLLIETLPGGMGASPIAADCQRPALLGRQHASTEVPAKVPALQPPVTIPSDNASSRKYSSDTMHALLRIHLRSSARTWPRRSRPSAPSPRSVA